MLYVPVDPTLKGGAIAALVPHLGADAAKPYPDVAPTVDDTTGIRPTVLYYETNVQAAASLGVGDVFKSSGNAFYSAVVIDTVVGVPKYRTGTIDPAVKILGTYWGFAVRLSLQVRAASTKVSGNMGAVAAAVEVGAAQVQYAVTGVGIDRGIFAASLAQVPLFGKFDYDAFAKISVAIDSITSAMSERLTTEPLLPIGVYLQDDLFDGDVVRQSRSARWAMARIRDEQTRDEALAAGPGWLDRRALRQVYVEVVGGDGTGPITEPARKRARNWLETE